MNLPTTRLAPRSGATLLTVAVTTALLALSVILFLQLSTRSRVQGRNWQAQRATDALLTTAREEVLAKLHEAHAAVAGPPDGLLDGSFTAAPGLLEIRRFDLPPNRGEAREAAAFDASTDPRPFFRDPFGIEFDGKPANPRWIPLYSHQRFAPRLPFLGIRVRKPIEPNPDYNPAASFNINTTDNPFYPGHPYLAGPMSAATAPALPARTDALLPGSPEPPPPETRACERPVWVQWIPVLRNASLPPGPDNPMIGRYAYWVDVENTKLHLHQAVRPLRESPLFVWAHGESDAALLSDGSHFAQEQAVNDFLDLRARVEASLPALASPATPLHPRASRQTPALAAPLAVSAFDRWLDWDTKYPPAAAIPGLVDWDFFTTESPNDPSLGGSFDPGGAFAALANETVMRPGLGLQRTTDLFAAIDFSQHPESQETLRQAMQGLAASALTVHGYETERDPLGRPKIDLVKFLLEAGQANNLDALKATELWQRLADPDYYSAYYPGGWPIGGGARSFIQGLNPFAGNGDRSNDRNGEAAALQLLVNMVEGTRPDNVPPMMDESIGVVGVRSIPYVSEVATRARTALLDVPEPVRDALIEALDDAKPEVANAALAAWQYDGHDLRYYLDRVRIELAFGCVNPDPFASTSFHGALRVDLDWGPLPPGSDVRRSGFEAPLVGRFTISPRPGKEPGKADVEGRAVSFDLGTVPGRALIDREYATALRIRGWEIIQNGQTWHKVPVRHPGGGPPAPWWQMTAQDRNVGKLPTDPKKEEGDGPLAVYHHRASEFGYRAVGWFSRIAFENAAPFPTAFDFCADGSLYFHGETGKYWGRTAVDGEGNVLHEARYWKPNAALDPPYEPLYPDSTCLFLDANLIDWSKPLVPEEIALLREFLTIAPTVAMVERVRCLDPRLGHRTGDPSLESPFGKGHLRGLLGHGWRYAGALEAAWTFQRRSSFRPDIKDYQIEALTQSLTGHSAPAIHYSASDGLLRTARRSLIPQWTAATPIPDPEHPLWTGKVWSGVWKADTGGTQGDVALVERPDLKHLTALFDVPTISGAFPLGALELGKAIEKEIEIPDPKKPGKTKKSKHTDIETEAFPVESKLTERDPKKGGAHGFFAAAFTKRLPVALGEIGLVHSGFFNRAIDLGQERGANQWQLNSPVNGPPMRMLLDLFTPGAFVDEVAGGFIPPERFHTGDYRSHTPEHPRRGLWSVNDFVCHDAYLLMREGDPNVAKPEDAKNPILQSARAVWRPGGFAYARRELGFEGYWAKNWKDHVKHGAGLPLDRRLQPFPAFSRPWQAWLGVIGGDVSTGRSGIGFLWSHANPIHAFYHPSSTAWSPGHGAVAPPVHLATLASLTTEESDLGARLMTLGIDGRDKDKNDNSGFLRGHSAADQYLDVLFDSPDVTPPLHTATRFQLLPMRHGISELGLEFADGIPFAEVKTALNPRRPAAFPTLDPTTNQLSEESAEKLDGGAFPGGAHATGIFYHAPLILMTNVATTAANAFTIHVVAQRIEDSGEPDSKRPKSGPGYCDFDDRVLSEVWQRTVLVQRPPQPDEPADATPIFDVLSQETR